MDQSALHSHLESRAGMKVILGAQACQAAIQRYGGIRRISLITPYMPSGDAQVRRAFSDNGLEVVNLLGLKCNSPLLMAHESPERLRRAVREVDDSSVELILQVGTNLARFVPTWRISSTLESSTSRTAPAAAQGDMRHQERAVALQTEQVDDFEAVVAEGAAHLRVRRHVQHDQTDAADAAIPLDHRLRASRTQDHFHAGALGASATHSDPSRLPKRSRQT